MPSGADRERADRERADLKRPDLEWADRERADLRRPDLEWAVQVAEAALTLDAAEAGALVRRLAAPPAGRRWTALVDGGGVVMASMSDRDPGAGHIDLLAVHPDEQGRGLGRRLVRAAEEWLRGQGATQARFAGNPPCYAWPGIDVRYTAAACLAESLGYERHHVAWNMTADLTSADLSTEGDVTGLAARGVAVRAADTAADRERVAAFVREHWNERWAWEAANAAGLHYAERDGEPLAFAAWGARPAWFGPMGTAPAARGLGVGRVLLRRCLADLRAAGYGSAQIGWVGPLRFYSRAVGARAERVFWLYRRDLA
ncbi:GNAT family N-acetyltransferase [Nonomuraea indica]|uniref:GNAT family N-acetyltransferase n=1 Tax=Nonomuraea indica TaxID=1581193 RepID=UPI001FE3B76F|nr:GNAT family N-acetyltransferase [Nonomuraea indica]